MEDWIRLATDIELNYAAFDGFIILHGTGQHDVGRIPHTSSSSWLSSSTDTMAYTSSALSFLLQDLGKTVIVTGAQIPLGELRNDAVDNFLGSLILAGGYVIPEVSLYFGHRLFRGNRARKVSSLEFGAFASPNMDPLGTGEWRSIF
jgi:lysophospholipase